MLGGLLRVFQASICPIQFEEHRPAVLTGADGQPFGLPTLDRFPQVSAMPQEWSSTGMSGDAENSRNRSNLAILPFTIFRGRALSSISDSQQGTHGPLILRQKRNAADARPRGVIRGCRTTTRAFNSRSRVSALLIAARDQETKCTLSSGADNRRSATAEVGNGKNGQV